MVLKQTYSKLHDNTMAKVKILITFPGSEAIIESWASVIDKIVRNKVEFKEYDSFDIVNVTENFLFIKLVGPSARVTKIEI